MLFTFFPWFSAPPRSSVYDHVALGEHKSWPLSAGDRVRMCLAKTLPLVPLFPLLSAVGPSGQDTGA